MFIPTEFTNMDVDDRGFILTTNIDIDPVSTIRRLNPHGDDVIVNFNENDKPFMGDLRFVALGPAAGTSRFVDVLHESGMGMYRVLDANRGRVFTYDTSGNLLYVFGGIGNVLGMMDRPIALDSFGDYVVVLDAGRNALVFFTPTLYGRLVNDAVRMQFEGDEAGAVEIWREVLRLDSNNSLANVGVGRSLLAAGEYRAAMEYLRMGMDIRLYSEAFRFYRSDVLRRNLPVILTTAVALLIIITIFYNFHPAMKQRRMLKRAES